MSNKIKYFCEIKIMMKMSWSIGTVYTKPWFWQKGNRVSTISDVLTIKIGGDPNDKKAKKQNNRIKSTKYTLITFLPQNLLEQFRRIANFYFLIMTIIAIVIESPVSPLTSLIPLVFVIAVTAAKQGYEDFLRNKADNMVNFSLVTVIRNGDAVDVKSQDILQGDLVKAARDCDVPCDIVLLKSSDPNGKCYVTTANLDGETNLKSLSIPKGLPNISIEKMHTLGIIECEQPRTDLYTFNGRIELSQKHRQDRDSILIDIAAENRYAIPLMAENLLLRGSRIKNTEWAIGCAVYTGQTTKLALNSRLTRNKMSSSEKFINKFLIFFLVLLIAIVTISYFIKRYFDMTWYAHNIYLGNFHTYQVSQFLQDYFSFLILFNYLIPISLYVTIEMHKFLGSFFMEWDINLYDAETNQPFIVNTSDLNEELGQVNILFSDKTGTLTKNEMIFQQCSINGKSYMFQGSGIQEEGKPNIVKLYEFREDVFEFFQTLAVCHTVQVAGSEDVNIIDDNQINDAQNAQNEEIKKITTFNHISEENDLLSNNTLPESDADVDSGGSRGGGSTSYINKKRGDLNHHIFKKYSNAGDFYPLLNKNSNEVDINFIGQQHRVDVNDDDYNDDKIITDMQENGGEMMTTMASTTTAKPMINAITTISDVVPPSLHTGNGIIRDRKQRSRPTSDCTDNIKITFSMDNKVHPDSRTSSTNLYNSQQILTNNTHHKLPQKTQNILIRPLSVDFKRTQSYIEDMEQDNNVIGHRRTQSLAATTTNSNRQQEYLDMIDGRPPLRTLSFVRSTSNMVHSREYYAAPAFTESSLIERKESTRRKEEIKTTIQNLDYQASSPDEKALVEACAKIGFLYLGEERDIMTIKLQPYKGVNKNSTNNNLIYERLHVLEFTSDRKRMSTIVKDRQGQIWLFTKGAESHVLPLCKLSSRTLVAATQSHINEYAKLGLRTLAVARKKLTPAEYASFKNEILAASNSLTDQRKFLIEEVQSKLETNLELLGATAVEDALQDNVRDTLESLRHAGIKVWVLTGDKVETALNIALSCGHIPETANRYFITECKDENDLKEHLNVLEDEIKRNKNDLFSLLIDGSSLAIALKHSSERFRDISIKCRAVLCCRLSPLQKCEVVQLMKTVPDKPITAAIGDGANDVSMIQEAHVGLGIVGKEGRQAARCADYAFANFSMAKRLILVHGHYYTQRLALLVLYFFYKNLVFMSIQFFFQMNSMFSSQTVYDSVFLTLYNVVYTALPVLFISLTEKVHPEEKLMDNPILYQENTRNKRLTWKYFCGWMLLACYHGTIIYISGFIMWNNNNVILTTPYTVNFFCYGTFMIHNVVVIVNLKLWLESIYQTYWFIFTIIGSILAFMLTTIIYNLFDLDFDGDMLWVYNNLLSSLTFWLLSMVIIIAALIPDYTMKVCKAFNIKIGPIFPGNRNSHSQSRRSNQTGLETTYL